MLSMRTRKVQLPFNVSEARWVLPRLPLCNEDRSSLLKLHKENNMSEIREHMKIIGKDGAHVGTVDRVEGNRIKLTRKDSPEGHKDHHHYIDTKYVGAVEGDVVKLSVNADAVPKSEAA
jgi:hypothetical protein